MSIEKYFKMNPPYYLKIINKKNINHNYDFICFQKCPIYRQLCFDGYKFDRSENLPLTITNNPDNNVIKIYYIKDSFG